MSIKIIDTNHRKRKTYPLEPCARSSAVMTERTMFAPPFTKSSRASRRHSTRAAGVICCTSLTARAAVLVQRRQRCRRHRYRLVSGTGRKSRDHCRRISAHRVKPPRVQTHQQADEHCPVELLLRRKQTANTHFRRQNTRPRLLGQQRDRSFGFMGHAGRIDALHTQRLFTPP